MSDVREPTADEVEAAARVAWDADHEPGMGSWDNARAALHGAYLDIARAVLRHAYAQGPDAVLSRLVESLTRDLAGVTADRDEHARHVRGYANTVQDQRHTLDQIAAVLGCEPEDGDDLVEAVRICEGHRDDLHDKHDALLLRVHDAERERDAAIARAERAERERDEASAAARHWQRVSIDEKHAADALRAQLARVREAWEHLPMMRKLCTRDVVTMSGTPACRTDSPCPFCVMRAALADAPAAPEEPRRGVWDPRTRGWHCRCEGADVERSHDAASTGCIRCETLRPLGPPPWSADLAGLARHEGVDANGSPVGGDQ